MSNTKINLNRQSDLILNDAQIINPVGIEKSDLPGLVDDLANLDSDITAEASRAIVAEESLSASLSEEIVARISDINAEQDRAEAAETSLENLLSGEISVELAARVAGDLSLQNQIDFITSNVDPAAIDSLTEIVAAFQSADGEINGAITELAGAAGSNLSAEISNRIAADASLATLLSSEISTEHAHHIEAEASLESVISSEESSRIAGEASLDAAKLDLAGGTMSGNIDMDSNEINNLNAVRTDELSNRAGTSGLGFDGDNITFGSGRFTYLQAPVDGGDATNKTYVDAGDAALAADLSDLQSYVDTTVNNAIDTLTADLSAETTRAESADASLESFISSENSVMNNLIDFRSNSLESSINTEQSRINAILDGSTVDLDTFAEIVSYINNIDLENDNASLSSIVSLELEHRTDSSIETAERIAGDASIQSELDAMPSTDNATIEIDAVDNVIKLKDIISAPDSGVRTFEGDVKASSQPDTLASYDEFSFITKGILDVTIAEVGTVSADLSTEIERAQAAEASIQAELDAMPSTDNATIEVDGDTNVIRLKQVIAAPDSGFRMFEGDVKAYYQPDTLPSYDNASYITKGILEAAIADEAILREAADAELDGKIADIISNTDLTSIDSFTELIDKVNEVTAANFDSIYAKKVAVTFDGVDAVTLATPVKAESMMLYINGLMVDNGEDYTEVIVDGFVVGATLIGDAITLALNSAKLNAYGVHGSFENITF